LADYPRLALNHHRRAATFLSLSFAGLLTGQVQALEPVFEIQQRSIPDTLAPERLPASFYDFNPDEHWAEPNDSYWIGFSNWVLQQERVQGQKVQRFGQWADRTLSGSDQGLPDNTSYLRIGFATESEYGDLAQFKPEARFRLDIPTTRRKLRLVIESESDELIPLEERSRRLTESDKTSTSATGALRYLSKIGNAIDLSNDIGVRLHIPPDIFWRVTAQKQWQVDKNWLIHAQQRFYYYHQDGWGERTWLGVGRLIWDDWAFRSSSELEWVHKDSKFVTAQIFSLYKQVNNRSFITPRIGVLGESKPSWRTSSAFADVTWRYRLYSDWVFAELIPALTFPRDEGFTDQVSVIFRLELYFSGNIQRAY
jgi:hypothetical protein